jgi:hypothetical protein
MCGKYNRRTLSIALNDKAGTVKYRFESTAEILDVLFSSSITLPLSVLSH